MHCLKLRHALLAGDRSSSAAIASTIGYSNHTVSNVLDQRTFYLSLLRSVIATIPPGRSPPSRKTIPHLRTISGNFTPNPAAQSVLRSIHVTQRQGSFIANSASQTLAARQYHTRHSYAWKPMPKRTFTRAAFVSPPWFGNAPARAMQRMFAARCCVQTLSTLSELLVVIATDGMFAAWCCVQMLSRGACGSDRVCSE